MPVVRVHKATDGQLFESYDDYIVHQEGIKFNEAWSKEFAPVFADVPEFETQVKEFIRSNQDALVDVIQKSKVKRTGKKKK